MVSWSRGYLAAVTQPIWTRTGHIPYFPRLLLQPLRDYFIIPLWVELLRTHSSLLGVLFLKCEQGLSLQWMLCPVLTLAYAKVFRRAEGGQLPSHLKKQPQRQPGAGLKYVTTELIAWHHKKCPQKTLCILMLLFHTVSQHCWSILIFAWPSHALWSPVPPTFPRARQGVLPRGNGENNSPPQLCWHLPCLSYPLQPKLFFTPRLWWRWHRALQARRFLLISSQAPPASSARCHCHIYHGETHANRKHNGLTHLFPLVIDNLSWLS